MLNICYESTKVCNLNCDYCITSDNPEMTRNDNYVQIISYIASLRPERLVISGGEPLLDPLLTDKLKLISEKMPDTYVSISTNGTVNQRQCDFKTIIDYVDCIDFSIPSVDNTIYSNMRGKDCIDTVKDNISILKKLLKSLNKSIDVRISYTLTKVNKDSLKDVLKYAEEVEVNSLRIGRFFPFRNAKKFTQKYELSDSEIKEVLNNCNIDSYKFKIIKPIENLDIMENGYLTINFNGQIFHPTREGKKILGNIDDTSANDLLLINENQQFIFKNIDTKQFEYIYFKYLSPKRVRDSQLSKNRTPQDEFNSDRTRIIYSSSFRRLQQKAQVFSLEKNSNVRSRLTHSLEVSDVGRILTTKITEKLTQLNGSYRLNPDDCSKIISIVENACLMHDLGNPPFGHFGEDAIKKWWLENKEEYITLHNRNASKISSKSIDMSNNHTINLQKDFELFDGNPQGFRIATRLYSFNDNKNQNIESGLNLTYSTLMCALKYVGCSDNLDPSQIKEKSITKKPGYFISEQRIVKHITESMKLTPGFRFPFTYIMEAADDIAYCMSDIADGIEKKVITAPQFAREFKECWEKQYKCEIPEEIFPKTLMKDLLCDNVRDFNTNVFSRWANFISNEVVKFYTNNIQEYMSGAASEIINIRNVKPSTQILNTLKSISNKIIYRSQEAEGIEVAGFSIVSGLLNFFGVILKMPKKHFDAFVYNNNDFNEVKKKYAYEFRVFNMLSKRCVESYRHQIDEWETDNPNKVDMVNIEWWLRVHLIIDHISGMTDDYALQTYQLAKGIDIKI